MITVGIVGGAGYTGSELLRLLTHHPQVTVKAITSRGAEGRRADDLFQHLRGHTDLVFRAPQAAELEACDCVFFATPNGVAMHDAVELLAAGVRVIDLSADFRLPDTAVWARWYGKAHAAPALAAEAVYGLPELNREAIRHARLIANPGCYPTATLLGLLPLAAAGLIALDDLIADCKSGVSGAGRTATVATLMGEIGENFKAYAATGHRHQPEIRSVLERLTQSAVDITFVPHLVPMIRGIEATVYGKLVDNGVETAAELRRIYQTHYERAPFVDVLPEGVHPETRSVKGSNVCRIAVFKPDSGRRVVVSSVIDNLVKGAAGQAVQNMNLMFGYDERTGLDWPGLQP